jgi:GNAT superfamily N-acetyltransferase
MKGILQKAIRRTSELAYKSVEMEIWTVHLKNIAEFDLSVRREIMFKRMQYSDQSAVNKAFGGEKGKKLTERLNGNIGYLAYKDEHVVGYAWSTDKIAKAQGIKPFLFDILPRSKVIYFYDDFVIPEMRGKGLNTVLMHYRLSESRKLGFQRAVGIIETKNIPQIKIHQRYGFIVEGRVKFRRICGHTFRDVEDVQDVCKVR